MVLNLDYLIILLLCGCARVCVCVFEYFSLLFIVLSSTHTDLYNVASARRGSFSIFPNSVETLSI